MKILWTVLMMGLFTFGVNAQTKSKGGTGKPMNLRSLCYDELMTERIRIPDKIDLDKLTIADKLKFVDKKYNLQQSKSFDATGNATKTTTFVSHKNMFPEWYVHPSKFVTNSQGLRSYFGQMNPLIPGGWVGATTRQTEHGVYEIDPATGERYHHQTYDVRAAEAYTNHNIAAQNFGYLYQSRFAVPTAAQLNELRSAGFNVTQNAGEIEIGNNDINIKWDLKRYRMVTKSYEANQLRKTTTSIFKYQDFCQDYLVTKEVAVLPKIFESGDCYEIINLTFYENYAGSCRQASKPRSSENNELVTAELKVFPNPATSELTIEIPAYDGNSELRVYNVAGEIIDVRQVAKDTPLFHLNLSNYAAGMYYVKVDQGATVFTKKFIKQ